MINKWSIQGYKFDTLRISHVLKVTRHKAHAIHHIVQRGIWIGRDKEGRNGGVKMTVPGHVPGERAD